MCDSPPPPVDLRLSRRRFLVVAPAGVAAASLVGGARASVAAAAGLTIVPRSDWGGDLAPKGPIPDEPDVRVLLVHHSVNANTYAQSAVRGLLRGIYDYHTTSKGWPDVAYNFFVDRFGGVWEGRTGSLAGAKAGDATGGNQGYSQLCCFIGDHTSEPPSSAAQAAMGSLLGWLAGRHSIDLSDGARARFTSRGSNKYRAGAAVDVATVSGHRDVTQTSCPGDAAYALVANGTFRRLAGGGGGAAPVTTAARPAPTTTGPRPTTTTTTAASTTSTSTSSSTTSTPVASTTSSPSTSELAAPVIATDRTDDGGADWPAVAAGSGVVAAAAGLVVTLRRRLERRA